MTKHICGSIEYEKNDGHVHSDLCSETVNDEYRQLLHDCLDEWLNNSHGTGHFYIGSEA